MYRHMELSKLLSLDTTTEIVQVSDPYSSSIVVSTDRVHLNRHIKNHVYRDVNILRNKTIEPYKYLFEKQDTIGDETFDSPLFGFVITNKGKHKHYSTSYVHPEENYSYRSAIPLYVEISPYSNVILHELFFNDALLKIFKIVYVIREGASLIIDRSFSCKGVISNADARRNAQAQVVESKIIQHPGSNLSVIATGEQNNYLQDLYFVTAYEKTSTNITGRYHTTEDNSVHVITDINHIADNSISNVDVKSVVDGNSRFTFSGNINVEKEAVDIDANLQNKNLQLSDKATVVTEPKLDIKTKEIACKHGCTVSSIDPDQIYLLNTKGIDTDNAKKILTESFLSYTKNKDYV